MSGNGEQVKIEPQSFYDSIADLLNIAMKLNGYQASLANYLRFLNLELNAASKILDAGCGTGIVSLALKDAGPASQRSFALDLSFKSLQIAREEFQKSGKSDKKLDPMQGDILQMPFADDTFDLVLMCGVLEYVPLEDGLRETARILKKGAHLVLLPVKPSAMGTVLEVLYKFKAHSLSSVRETAGHFFNIVGNHKFPLTDPIAWTKTVFLLEKK